MRPNGIITIETHLCGGTTHLNTEDAHLTYSKYFKKKKGKKRHFAIEKLKNRIGF